MHVILTSIGTDGDIYPFIGLGQKLKAMGHAVTLAVSEHYQPLAIQHGFQFSSLVSSEENWELFDHPDFWNPVKTGPLAAKWGLKHLPRQYELMLSLIQSDSVIVANPGVFAARLASEKTGCPIVSLILQPWIIPSSIAPPMMPGLHAMRRAPRIFWDLFWRSLDLYGAMLIGRGLNRFRASLGLKPMRRIFRNWLSSQLAIGMFPDWYGPRQPDWPRQIQIAGFPLSDGRKDPVLPNEVLRFCETGKPPVVFTFGTGMRHSAPLFRLAVEAMALTDLRAIFLTKHRDQLPDPLPSNIFHCEFASFHRLFPHCSAVVHHGGIGTSSQAMAAGKPQLILPICFDQADNGERVRRLQVGDWLSTRRQQPNQVAQALSRLQSPEIRQQCEMIRSRLDQTDGLAVAAQKICELR